MTPTTDDLTDLLGFEPSAEQRAAITAPLEPGLVSAGAGTGKTSVMAARVVWLVAGGQVGIGEVLGLTFTTKAVAELSDRIDQGLAHVGVDTERAGSDLPTVRTYHGFARDLLEQFGVLIGVEPDCELLTDVTRLQRVRALLTSITEDLPSLRPRLGEAARIVLALDDALAEQDCDPASVLSHCAEVRARAERHGGGRGSASAKVETLARVAGERADAVRVVQRWREWKRSAGVLDFADQVRCARELIAARPEVGSAIRSRYRVVLLDEYQDTSTGQRSFLQQAFSGGHPVTAVGDPLQAIFEWRAAAIENIQHFPTDFPRADRAQARTWPLTINRRSLPRIIDTANALTDGYREQVGAQPLVCGRWPEPSDAEEPLQLAVGLYLTWREEVAAVADRIAEGAARTRQRGGHLDGMAVLARTNSQLGELRVALEERGVPAALTHVDGLLGMPEVVELIAFLEVLGDPGANPATLRLLSGPRWGLSSRDLALLGRRAVDLSGSRSRPPRHAPLAATLAAATAGLDPLDVVSLSDAAADPGPGPYGVGVRESLADFTAVLGHLRSHAGEPVADLIGRVLAVTGLAVEVATGPSASGSRGGYLLDAVTTLADDVARGAGTGSLPAFLAWVRLARESGTQAPIRLPAVRDAVALSTVHSAKGLEWPVVHVVGLSPGSFPARPSRPRWTTTPDALPCGTGPQPWTSTGFKAYDEACRKAEMVEELRLAYVAVTRARDELVMTGHHWGPRQRRPRGPSTFLNAAHTVASEPRHGSTVAILHWQEEPGEANPELGGTTDRPWLPESRSPAWHHRQEVAKAVRRALREPGTDPADGHLRPADAATAARWRQQCAAVLARAGAPPPAPAAPGLPDTLSATVLLGLADDRETVSRALARPLPQRPSAAAQRGRRLHARIEGRLRRSALFDPEELPGAADEGLFDDAAVDAAFNAFQRSRWAGLPVIAVEWQFSVVNAGRILTGRVDAVVEDGRRIVLVDWKTSPPGTADPRQLAVYRLAYSELNGHPPERIDATYVYLPSLAEVPCDVQLTWEDIAAWYRDP